RYGEISKQRLDRAILTFFQNFRKSYVGDHAMHSSKVKDLGLVLQHYFPCMFDAFPFPAAVILEKENFQFLEEYRCLRSRTTFYYTLGYLIFMEDSPVKFKASMEPLLQVSV
ncbi:hypothetical protein BHE74_00048574, partial [Ensete ventricosum]